MNDKPRYTTLPKLIGDVHVFTPYIDLSDKKFDDLMVAVMKVETGNYQDSMRAAYLMGVNAMSLEYGMIFPWCRRDY